jgi:hypothetical protein
VVRSANQRRIAERSTTIGLCGVGLRFTSFAAVIQRSVRHGVPDLQVLIASELG